MSGSTDRPAKAILYAFLANIGIAVTKAGAAIYTNSGSMVAEALHSYADCLNQLLLFFGLKQADLPPTTEHPLGYGKASYFWSFVVALMLFSMGGLFSIYEGWHKLRDPEPFNKAWVALAVLARCDRAGDGQPAGCLREIRKIRNGRPFLRLAQVHAQCRTRRDAWAKTSPRSRAWCSPSVRGARRVYGGHAL